VSDLIFVAMSGGVDSSVAALLLHESGHDVVGAGLKLLAGDGGSSCCSAEAMGDARRVADCIGIPFYVLDYEAPFSESVIDYFASSYACGETPNPCVPCNKEVKFDGLLRVALGAGAGHLATGHYARVEDDPLTGRVQLLKGLDPAKDQSYFLYSLTQQQLARASFPVGGMTKEETRARAKAAGLPVHDKPESQDVCFVDGSCADFVVRRHPGSGVPGRLLDSNGEVIGIHRGIASYTLGQRRRLGVGGEQALYVADIDAGANTVTVVPREKYMTHEPLELARVNYVSIEKAEGPMAVTVKTRYRGAEMDATLVPAGEGEALLEFSDEREPVAPGQSAVIYNGDVVVAGGVARRRAPDG
jgi:tRNA-specific 2-thiouridylase